MAIGCRGVPAHGVMCRESLAFPGVRVTQAKTLKAQVLTLWMCLPPFRA